MKSSLLSFKRILTLAIFMFFIGFSYAQDGEALFNANCKSCHYVTGEKLIGPGLQGIEKRRTRAWLYPWIKNSQAVVKSGDAYAVNIFNEYNKTVMTAQNLSNAEIDAILDYVKKYVPPVTKAPVGGPVEDVPAEDGFPWLLLFVTSILIIVALALGRIQKSLQHALRDKEGQPHPALLKGKAFYKIWIRGNKKLIAGFLVIGALIGSVKGWYALKDVGVTQGYEPDQPIKFSHKLHAGQNGIACLYCHSGAEQSKHANIPSAILCMNCHKGIKKGPNYGTEEISKIYAALDWDGSKYGSNQKPIQWTRVHNLPDLAYFNHSQHVKVGKIECQQCHGAVEKMEIVKQDQPLTMGWCIDCHRTTEVKVAGNGYYDEKALAGIHKQYGADAKITVEKIGGTECARCHY
jgi:mono/diheme cytochrome c family protein